LFLQLFTEGKGKLQTVCEAVRTCMCVGMYLYEGWNFNSGNYLFTTDTK